MASPGAPGGTGTRDREAYFAAAMALLAERGCHAVTIAGLCERLQVTHGSFYHHFESMPAFVGAFAEHYQAWVMGLFAAYEAGPDPVRRFEVVGSGLELLDDGHAAVVAWARTEPVIAAMVETCQQVWNPIGVRVFTEVVGDPQLAPVLLKMIECIHMGTAIQPGGPGRERFLRIEQELWPRLAGLQFDLVKVDQRQELKFRSEDPHPAHDGFRGRDISALTWAESDPKRGTGTPGPARRARGREAYFAAARQLLGERGSDGLTVAALCRRLSVTKGSFHWHFERMGSFIEALADHWEQGHDCRRAAYRDQPDPVLRLQLLHQQLLVRPDPADIAWRAWAHTEPVIGQAVHRIDGRRRDLLAVTIHEATQDSEAELLAQAMLGLTIGLKESDQPDIDPDLAARIVLEWARRVLHLDAQLHIDDGQPTIKLTPHGD